MDEQKLEEMYKLTRENHAMLRSMRRSAFIGGAFKLVWWILILVVLPYITWLYLQPYLDTIMAQYQTIQEQSGAFSSQASELQKQMNSIPNFSDFFKQFGGGSGQ